VLFWTLWRREKVHADTVRILYTFEDTGLFTFILLVCCRSLHMQVSVMQEKTDRKRVIAVQHKFVTSVRHIYTCDQPNHRYNVLCKHLMLHAYSRNSLSRKLKTHHLHPKIPPLDLLLIHLFLCQNVINSGRCVITGYYVMIKM
jgi:hypothetical protein